MTADFLLAGEMGGSLLERVLLVKKLNVKNYQEYVTSYLLKYISIANELA